MKYVIKCVEKPGFMISGIAVGECCTMEQVLWTQSESDALQLEEGEALAAIAFIGDVLDWELAEELYAEQVANVTNADRIRAMSDEQLAEYWANNYDNFCQNKPECGELLDTDAGIPEEKCVACALAWLRRSSEEEQK